MFAAIRIPSAALTTTFGLICNTNPTCKNYGGKEALSGIEVKNDSSTVSVSKLVPNPWNPNRQNDFIFQKEKASIKKFGFVAPIIVRENGKKFEIIDGEHRLKAAIELGMKDVSINNLGKLTDPVAKQLTIVLNETKGEPDPIDLAKLVTDLSQDIDVEALAAVLPYTDEQLTGMMELVDFDWEQYEVERPDPDKKYHICPECGHNFEA